MFGGGGSAPPPVSGPALDDVLGDVLHSEGPEGLGCVLYDDGPGVRTVSAVVLDHLGQSLTGRHAWLGVRPCDEDFVLSVRAQTRDDGPEVLPERFLTVSRGQTGQYLQTENDCLNMTELARLL